MNSPALLDNLRVVLVATRNPLNIGAAARAMSNFGCTHLRLVNPYDPAYREAVSAVGAAPVLAGAAHRAQATSEREAHTQGSCAQKDREQARRTRKNGERRARREQARPRSR